MPENYEPKTQVAEIDLEDFESRTNLLGFLELLLKVDRRNNPERYESNEDNRSPNNTNKA